MPMQVAHPQRKGTLQVDQHGIDESPGFKRKSTITSRKKEMAQDK